VTRVALRDGLLTSLDDAGAARLLGGRCPRCARHSFPAQQLCPYCASDGCESVPLSAQGVVEVCTTVINRPPGYEGPLPFGFGVVELPEGIRIITRISQPDQAKPGTPVKLVLETVGVDAEGRAITTYAFALSTQDPGLRTQDSGLRTQD